MQIFIKTVEGRSIAINDVELNTTVEALKQKAQDKTGVSHDAMRLVYCGKQLEDGHDMAFYNIQKNSNIFMVFRLLGGSNKECTVCCEDKPSNDANFPKCTAGCTHASNVCKSCLQAHVKTEVNTKNEHNVKCMTCKLVLSGDEVRRHSPSTAVFEAWEQNAFNAFLISLPDFRWCSRDGCGFGEEFPHGSRYPRVQCFKCKAVGCFRHLANGKGCSAWHAGKTCEEYDAWLSQQPAGVVTEAWLNANTKSCPTCNCRIEKNGGCNQMTCKHCKADFCWLCNELWPKNASGGSSVPKHKQTCRYYGSSSRALFD
jgi:ubiquitin